MGSSERIDVSLDSGITLEAELFKAQPCADELKLAVCLHPWSWLGGRMNDPVLTDLTQLLQKKGHHVLRYNSRGVGRSTGRPSFTGFPEGEDLRAVVQWALQRVGGVSSLVLVGYSHGSLIASLHPVLPRPVKTSHLLVSYPLGPRGFLTFFNSSAYDTKLRELVEHPDSDVLIVFGDRDDFTSAIKYQRWGDELVGRQTGVVKVVSVSNGTHFWRDERMEELEREVERWLG